MEAVAPGRYFDVAKLPSSGAPNEASYMVKRVGKICLAAFPSERVRFNVMNIVANNIYLYGIRGEGQSGTKRAAALMEMNHFDATLIHTHMFHVDDLPEAIRYAKDRIEDTIKIVLKNDASLAKQAAAE